MNLSVTVLGHTQTQGDLLWKYLLSNNVVWDLTNYFSIDYHWKTSLHLYKENVNTSAWVAAQLAAPKEGLSSVGK
jgi:hypothetical protein